MDIKPTSFTISQLLGSEREQYVIPSYQRRYSWHLSQIEALWNDIDILENRDTHLLGTIVCLAGLHTADINQLELVDGQQRLTTIIIILFCIHERLKKEEKHDDARDIEKILYASSYKGKVGHKVLLDTLDEKQFDKLVRGENIDQKNNGPLTDAFSTVRKWIEECSLEEIHEWLYKLKNQALIIRLDVSNAKDAFKLFETINNRGLRLSVHDIIKNFILGNAARFGDESLDRARARWGEIINHLDEVSSEDFFRQYMMAVLQRRVSKSLVVESFQKLFMQTVKEAETLPDRGWYCDIHGAENSGDDEDIGEENEGEGVDELVETEEDGAEDIQLEKCTFENFLRKILKYSKAYKEVVLVRTSSPILDRHLRNLKLIRAKPAYGFLMLMRAEKIEDKVFQQVLRLTESFLMRRHVCRERTGENEVVFAKACAIKIDDSLINNLKVLYRTYSADDERFEKDFAETKFNSFIRSRARYSLEQFEIDEQGQYVELLPAGSYSVEIEHVIPQTIKSKKSKEQNGDWPKYLGKNALSDHPRYVNRIGNLTLFAGELNIVASNNPYESKKESYNKSAFKITKTIPKNYNDFRYDEVESRSWKLAKRAVKLWPIP